MINLETGLPYAKFDHSDTRIRQAQYVHVPSWQGAMIHCLKVGDRESAELIRDRNLPHSDECQYDDHDLCRVLWCKCVCHSRVQFEIEHPIVKSLSELDSEREEMEMMA